METLFKRTEVEDRLKAFSRLELMYKQFLGSDERRPLFGGMGHSKTLKEERAYIQRKVKFFSRALAFMNDFNIDEVYWNTVSDSFCKP